MTSLASSIDIPAAFVAREIAVNGVPMCCIVGGSGAPVVLLHGWPQTWWAWRHIAPMLAGRGRTVIVPDLRGAGGSAKVVGGYEKASQAKDVRELVHLLGFGRTDVVGHDLGGMIAYDYACLFPTEVASLVLVDVLLPALGLAAELDVGHGGSFHFGFYMEPGLAESLIEGREPAFFAWWFAKMAGTPEAVSAGDVAHYAEIYSGKAALAACFAQYRTILKDIEHDRRYATIKLPMPVLAITGEKSVGDRLATGLASATHDLHSIVLSGCGHFVPEERPRELCHALIEFLHLDDTDARPPAAQTLQ
jgi:pimeloyl-ACP methyl ester carboxylesterase